MVVFPQLAGDSAGFVSILLAAWVFLPVAAVAQMLPYIPTSIFLPTPKPGDNVTGSIAYIFSPRGDTVDLLALDTSATLVASSLSFDTISSGLPFIESHNTAFVPSLADNGSLIVYAGDCSTSTGSGIWFLDPSTAGAGSAKWIQESITPPLDTTWMRMGPSFLGTGFSFSTTLEPDTSPASTFVYGGMCPNNGTASTTQSDAAYSNQMLKISQSNNGTGDYMVNPIDSFGPPIPEAGFTFTGLAPSFSNRSGTITQQRDYVLLGGHTQYAFINISTVAVWSLPQEDWSFVYTIGMAGPGSASTTFAVNDTVQSVDSRSGHSAILSEDGTALIVLGGWVGDPTQAAFPQLAVLNIGWDRGGAAEWQWSIPESQPSGDAIYGHGATLLPGNVMMVYGGYKIPSSGSNNKRRASESAGSFLNLTSMSWSNEYTNPFHTDTSSGDASGGNTSTQKQKISLGLGLGLGLGLTLIPTLFFVLYRTQHQRRMRDSAIRALSQDNSRFVGHDELADYDGNMDWYTGGRDPYARGSRSLGYQSLQAPNPEMENTRQNWFGDLAPVLPPMLQLNRKTVAPRGMRGPNQPGSAGAYEQVSSPRGIGGMNPIFEADEDETGDIGAEAMSPARDGRRDSGAYSDPFDTPTQDRPISFPPPCRNSQTPSPEERNRASVTDPDVQDWMTDIDAADALLSGRANAARANAAVGRSSSRRGNNPSPEEDGMGTENNAPEATRNNLGRSGSLLRQLRNGFTEAAAAVVGAATDDREGSTSSGSVPSYSTARTFLALQAEGPGLLMGREVEKGDDMDDDQEPGSPSKNKPLRRSWLGSIRRVFAGTNSNSSSPRTMDGDGQFHEAVVDANEFETRTGGLGGIGGIAADVLSRRKSGRKAWEPLGAGSSQAATRYAPLHGETADGAPSDDEEWDIEKAVEKRLVQFMFTVPKEPLRIVNAEPDFVSERDVVLAESKKDEEQHLLEGGSELPKRVTTLQPPSDQEERFWTLEEGSSSLPKVIIKSETPPKEGSDSTTNVTRSLEHPYRLTPTPGGLSDEVNRLSTGLSQDTMIKTSQEELRRELQREWARIEAEEALPEAAPEAPEPLRLRASPPAQHSTSTQYPETRAPELDHLRSPSPLLQRHPRTQSISGLTPGHNSLTLEEQLSMLGTELHQVRSAAQTPMSQISHLSDADVLSAQVVRFERPSGATSALRITPILTNIRNGRGGARARGPSESQKSPELRGESKLRVSIELPERSDELMTPDVWSESKLRVSIELQGPIDDQKTSDLRSDINLNKLPSPSNEQKTPDPWSQRTSNEPPQRRSIDQRAPDLQSVIHTSKLSGPSNEPKTPVVESRSSFSEIQGRSSGQKTPDLRRESIAGKPLGPRDEQRTPVSRRESIASKPLGPRDEQKTPEVRRDSIAGKSQGTRDEQKTPDVRRGSIPSKPSSPSKGQRTPDSRRESNASKLQPLSISQKTPDLRSEKTDRGASEKQGGSPGPKTPRLRSESSANKFQTPGTGPKTPDLRSENSSSKLSGRSSPQKTPDLRSESNLRAAGELRGRGSNLSARSSNLSARSVRAMVEKFENKSTTEASPAGPSSARTTPTTRGGGTPTRGGATPARGGTPTRGGTTSRGGTPLSSRGATPTRGPSTRGK